ncbi:uncharacterized protein LOC131167479 [Malania oleifera]|uniref:uncharacterized protein LOC131167479 n=1 Tax=Malania oleifera TaxID=397392 RepID=UPI0025AE2725|nr:uncharacterized protein LOC131167479 [Malania oleifera]
MAREAERWWHAMKLLEEQRTVPIAMTWGRFKQVFYNRYFPITTRKVKAEEFFNPTQERLTVQQYTTRFLELSRFAPSMVPDEYQKARWFERGLNQRIHKHMACLQIQDFAELVEKATIAESSLQRDKGHGGEIEISQVRGQKGMIEDVMAIRHAPTVLDAIKGIGEKSG